MAKVKEFFSNIIPGKNEHPIMTLLNARSGLEAAAALSSASERDFFLALPPLRATKKRETRSKLMTNDFYSAVAWISEHIAFSGERFQEKRALLEQRKGSGCLVIATLYEVLLFLIDAHDNAKRLSEDDFRAVLSVSELTMQMAPGYLMIALCLLREFLNLCIADNTYQWTQDGLGVFSGHLIENRYIEDYLSHQVTRVLIDVTSIRSCDGKPMIDAICVSMLEERSLINENDFSELLGIMNVYITNMNFEAIEIVSMISKAVPVHEMKNAFALLAVVTIAHVQGLPVTFEVPEERDAEKCLVGYEPLESMLVEFIDDSGLALENGFEMHKVPFTEPIDQGLSSGPVFDFLAHVGKSVFKAKKECIDVLVDVLRDGVMQAVRDEHFYDKYYTLLLCLKSVSGSLRPYIDMIGHPWVFDPRYTVFDGNIPADMGRLRNEAMRLLESCMEPSITELLVQNAKYPFLAAELMSWFVSAKCQALFMTEKCMECALKVIWYFIGVPHKSEKVISALHTALDFVLSSLHTRDCFKNEECAALFKSVLFVKGFVNLSFVSVLQQMVLGCVRDFMIQNSDVPLDLLCSHICDLIKKCLQLPKEPGIEFVCRVSDMLTYAVSHNVLLVESLHTTLEELLGYARECPTLAIMQSHMKFISLMMQNVRKFQMGANLIKTVVEIIKKVGEKESVLLNVVSVCASTSLMETTSLFHIKQASFIPIAFAAFGESRELQDLTRRFIDLCEFSAQNCVQCHKSGIDSMLLDFVRVFMMDGSKTVVLRGFQFNLGFTRSDIDELVLPFLALVCRVYTNNMFAQRIINLVFMTDHTELCMLSAEFLNNQMAALSEEKKPVLQLGRHGKGFVIPFLDAVRVNRCFSFCFWLKCDNPISSESQIVPILTVSNDLGTEFTLFVSRDSIYASFNRSEMSEQCLSGIQPNTWIHITFIIQRSSVERSTVGMYLDRHICYCQEVKPIYFERPSDVKVTFGGAGDNKAVGVIGPFILTDKTVGEDEVEHMCVQGPTSYSEFPEYIIRTEPDGEIMLSDGLKMQGYHPYDNVHSLQSVLRSNRHGMSFVPLFKKLDSIPAGLEKLVIGIMKHIMDRTHPMKCASVIGEYLRLYSRTSLVYSLYVSFFSLLDVSASVLLIFDNLVVNIDLWCLSEPMCFCRIVHHWAYTVVNTCPYMFTRSRYLTKLIVMFEHLFFGGGLSDKFTEAERVKCQADFMKLITESAGLHVELEDLLFVTKVVSRVADTGTKLSLIQLIETSARSITGSGETEIVEFLCSCLEHTDIEINIGALRAAHEVSRKVLQHVMTTISLQMRMSAKRDAIFDRVVSEFGDYHGFIHILCSLALTWKDEYCMKMVTAFRDWTGVPDSADPVLNDKMWFMWPLLLATKLEGDELNVILRVIGKFIVADQSTIPQAFTRIGDVVQLVRSMTEFDACQLVFDLAVFVEEALPGQMESFICDCIRAAFVKYSKTWTSRILSELIVHWRSDMEPSPCEFRTIGDILSFEELLMNDFTDFHFVFAVSVGDVGCLQLEKMECVRSLLPKLVKVLGKNGVGPLAKFVLHMLTKQSSSPADHRNALIRVTDRAYKVQETLDHQYGPRLHGLCELMKGIIRRAKADVWWSEGKSFVVTAPRYDQDGSLSNEVVSEYIAHIDTVLSSRLVRSHEICAGFVPSILQFQRDEGKFSDILGPACSREVLERVAVSKSLLFSYPGRQFRFGDSSIVQVTGLMKTLIIADLNVVVDTIEAADILMVLKRSESAIEIFCKTGGSRYIDFTQASADVVIGKIATFHDRLSEPLDVVQQRMLAPATTNFEYLVILNIFNGRSWHTKDDTLQLPVVEDGIIVREVLAEEFYLPEIVDMTPIEVYERRKKLETIDISAYASTTFSEHYSVKFPRPIVEVHDAAIYGPIPVKDYISLAFIGFNVAVLAPHNLLHFVKIEKEPKIIATQQVELPGRLYVVDSGVVVISEGNTAQFVGETNVSVPFQFDCDIGLCATDGSTFVFVGDECVIMTGTITDSLRSTRRLATWTECISALAVSESYQLVACGTNNGCVFLHSLVTGAITITIPVDADVERVMISPSWGAIVVTIERAVTVYTVNGTFVGKTTLDEPIRDCQVISDTHGLDYIVIMDMKNQIWRVEVMNPTIVHRLPNPFGYMTPVVYDYARSGILGITKEGTVVFNGLPDSIIL